MMPHQEKHSRGAVVITGASTGIGKTTALHLDGLGFRVFAGVRKDSDGEHLKRESSGRITPLRIDVTDASTITSAAGTVANIVDGAGLAGLVNNAGIAVAGPLEFLPLDKIRQQFEVNVFGLLAVTQAFLPLLRKARGRIVNMGSISGRVSNPFIAPYSASKFALESFTDALRVELMPWGISVSIIEPGNIATPIWDKSIAASDDLQSGLPQAAKELYGPMVTAVRKAAERSGKDAIPAIVVARAVAHALSAKRPKTRYLIGRDARIRLILRKLLPDRVMDRITMWYLGVG
jgi:NAD(P)-dependent dehydrogenase (short-subunit alcohol dehydrogenase family)